MIKVINESKYSPPAVLIRVGLVVFCWTYILVVMTAFFVHRSGAYGTREHGCASSRRKVGVCGPPDVVEWVQVGRADGGSGPERTVPRAVHQLHRLRHRSQLPHSGIKREKLYALLIFQPAILPPAQISMTGGPRFKLNHGSDIPAIGLGARTQSTALPITVS